MTKIKYIKKLIIFLLIIITLSVTGCTTREKEQKTEIIKADLTASEKGLLKAVGLDYYFVFDVHLSNLDVNWADFWIDIYQDGQLQGKRTSFGTQIDRGNKEDKNRLVLTYDLLNFNYIEENNKYQNWNLSFVQGEDASLSSIVNVVPVEHEYLTTAVAADRQPLIMGEEILLIVLVIKAGSGGIGISDSVFVGNEKALNEVINNNDFVYLLKGKFINK